MMLVSSSPSITKLGIVRCDLRSATASARPDIPGEDAMASKVGASALGEGRPLLDGMTGRADLARQHTAFP